MEINIGDNVRKLRKERSLTQEQLAEVLGVTTGAVYKWEAKLSVPDIGLIVEMADFFDTSVDVLLGYEMKDNRLEATVKRLQAYRREKNREGIAEAQKAEKKYPHSFAVIRECAAILSGFGIESGDKALLRRALELQERSLLLLEQNADPKINEQTICGQMATAYLGLNETERAIELLRANNAGGLYDHRIGQALATTGRGEEAIPFLSESMAGIIVELIATVIGYINVYGSRGDHGSAQAILRLAIGFLSGLREGDKPNYLDKVTSGMHAALAGFQYLSGQVGEARASLEEAKKLASFFDGAPSYDERDIRFIDLAEGSGAYDDIGATAADVVGNVVNGFENEAFSGLWRTVAEREDY